jgi:HEAT repeat protein
MGFDIENFGLGLLAGWGSAYAVYRARGAIKRVVGTVRGSAVTAQNSATRSADSRYVNDVIRMCETGGVFGKTVPLSAVAVEPRFIPAPALPQPPAEDAIYDVFRVIPLTHEYPYLYAPYPLETLSIEELALGHRHLALLGRPGSGRSTALRLIALHSLSGVKFRPPEDRVQRRIDSDEAALSEKERAVKIKERITIEQRAKERLASEKGLVFNAQADEELKKVVPLFNRLMPVYVHAADLFAPGDDTGEVDPAEPIVRAVQANVGRITASTIPRNLYRRLSKGEVLLLVDGFDELPDALAGRAAGWLNAFLGQYASNFVIVAGAIDAHTPLTGAGLVSVYMRPWNDVDVTTAATRWADAWAAGGGRGRRGGQRPAEDAVRRAATHARGLSPLEVTAKIVANYAETAETPGFEGWLRTSITRLAPAGMAGPNLFTKLAPLAALQLDDGWITAARVDASAAEGLGVNTAAPETEESTDALREAAEGGKAKGRGRAKGAGEGEEPETAQSRLLAALEKTGLLWRYREGRYVFRHRQFAEYLGSLCLKTGGAEFARARQGQAAWRSAFAYLALHSDVSARVAEALASPPDLLYSALFAMARWVAYAPADVPWRGDLLRDLGNLLSAPNMYPAVRERAAAALLETRDRSSAMLIFRRAVRNINPGIRTLGCLGLGAIGDPEGIRDLAPLLNDQVAEVQLAAGMGLGAVGTNEALEAMVAAFTQGAEPLRQAVAEALSLLPVEGYPILFDAVQDDDIMLRRASIFGLRRVRTTWALIAIYRAFLEDDQWYVRSAAQQAFEELQYGRAEPLTLPYPTPDTLSWLKAWAAERGENVPPGEGAQLALLRALQEGEPPVRALAALTLGRLGLLNAVKPLYASLRDRQDEVRAAAHQALGVLQTSIGQPLPAP